MGTKCGDVRKYLRKIEGCKISKENSVEGWAKSIGEVVRAISGINIWTTNQGVGSKRRYSM